MKILIAVASKHGSTFEIGRLIEQTVSIAGHQTELSKPEDVTDLSPYDAVVLGSAVYAGNWRPSAKKFASKHRQELLAMPFWMFSSGPLGTDEESDKDMGPVINNLVSSLKPIEHKVLSGKLDPADLKLSEKMIIRMVKAPYGDYRDKNEIVEWARSIIDYLADLE